MKNYILKNGKLREVKTTQKRYQPKLGVKIIIGLLLITSLFISVFLSIKSDVKAIKKVHCSDFKTQGEAQKAYEAGARYLDAGKHDGIACDSLMKK